MKPALLLFASLFLWGTCMAQENKGEPVEPRFMAVGKTDPAFLKSIADAQASLPFFLSTYESHRDKPGVFFAIKVPIQDGHITAHIWFAYRGMEGGLHLGKAFELPKELVQHDTVRVKAGVIEDWMVNDHGHLFGGFSIRLQRSMKAESERAAFDEYTGVKVYEATPF
jgi:uncharacterized protein YegJ (DUF2314 family)